MIWKYSPPTSSRITDQISSVTGTPPAAFFTISAAKSVRACTTRNSYTKLVGNAGKCDPPRTKERKGEKEINEKRRDLDSFVLLAREGGAPPFYPTKKTSPHEQASLRGNLRSRSRLFPFPRVRQDRRDESALTMDFTHPLYHVVCPLLQPRLSPSFSLSFSLDVFASFLSAFDVADTECQFSDRPIDRKPNDRRVTRIKKKRRKTKSVRGFPRRVT